MKFGIDMGHNAPPDVGASGYAQEDDLTKAVGTEVINQLEALGYETVNCTPRWASTVLDSLRKRVSTANATGVDIYVSIHFNAFNGRANGSEIYAVSAAGRRIAQPVLQEIINLGFYNRGVRDGSHLYVLKNTLMPAILIECCFLDSRMDMERYNTPAMVRAIVKGLTGETTPDDGDTGVSEDILTLQQYLNRFQIPDKNGNELAEDGIFGPLTASALTRFNDIMGINAQGRAGAATWKAINEIAIKPLLRPNHATGKATRYVQYRVQTAIDGIFGPLTAAAVERFQEQNHLAVDGIVGPQTWGALIG
ncbi:N-acetylmuramoyl-L-alanine amidase [Spirulina sp. CS-785/01]|uniref:N-acetylmuramoyl-L-alanine amidase n=1 Tax=Spirulina sp. CS-785/01 TaxID=3021716 RepID=UPI0023312501|nr:N-acetylmuramoyl-L-alanine amidase [Spirulina sp. CS-785/01]MDB9311716.1 N-acetylmuramoyl-L-alanine amidase [Spirulina sp. CS-785/01]